MAPNVSRTMPDAVVAGSRDSTVVIHHALRQDILSGAIAAGTWISQVQLAKRFGVSRGPIREALRLLEREGLIEAAVNQRSRVTDVSIDDLEQLYAARIVTESLGVASSVGKFTLDDLRELEGLLEALDEHAGVDLEAWEQVHRAFHAALVKHAGARLTTLLEQFYDHAERYRRTYVSRDPRVWSVGAAEHRQIVDACAAREAQRAAGLLARHLSRTALAGLTLMAPEHEPALLRTALRQVTASLEPSSPELSRDGVSWPAPGLTLSDQFRPVSSKTI